ncbi:MAG: CHAD domain-containing protein [Actinomycetota bacterium]|nr:CHAD domain-containing protein [Actinomycetota bacterium]
MSRTDPQFLADRFPMEGLTASLRPLGVSLIGDPADEVRRTWLDTFDWRLHRANAELQQIDVDGRTTLELRGDGERPLRATGGEIAGLAWPAIADTLPAGPLHDRIAALTGVRALQVTARATARRWTFRAVNSDDKTVARVLVEDENENDVALQRITVEPLRGYERQARRIGSTLASLPGVEAAPASSYERVLAAGGRITDGRQLGDRGARPDLGLTPSLPAASAVRAMLRSFREAVVTNRPGVLDDVDTEFLHDLRVAVRRARSIVKLTGDVLTDAPVHRLAAELKWLGDATGPTRDLDVYVAGIPAMTERLRAAAPTDLDSFGEHLRRRRGDALERLRTDLGSERFARLLDDWAVLASEPDEPAAGPAHAQPGGLTATELAGERLTSAHRRVMRVGAAITPASAPERLHALRKRCKELRYLIEVFEPLEVPGARKRALPVLKDLQDCLGEFQDSEVQAAAIRSCAAEMMSSGSASPGPLLAMGELAAQLDADQRNAREQFAGIFTMFQDATAKVRWTREQVRRK